MSDESETGTASTAELKRTGRVRALREFRLQPEKVGYIRGYDRAWKRGALAGRRAAERTLADGSRDARTGLRTEDARLAAADILLRRSKPKDLGADDDARWTDGFREAFSAAVSGAPRFKRTRPRRARARRRRSR